ncbi:hypothetical protein HPB51_028492 [Rhipicephalus microplus]|uniref:Uncharacterized protein n=1 Tax=Rhipicephalus microplus TaxID=6941 RepID=A0A9J6CXD5_RHIMP|nr:hypothetical protein HPB51_028492 [Rhipicephalus microplus]
MFGLVGVPAGHVRLRQPSSSSPSSGPASPQHSEIIIINVGMRRARAQKKLFNFIAWTWLGIAPPKKKIRSVVPLRPPAPSQTRPPCRLNMANAEDGRRKPSDMAQPSPLSPLSPSELRDEASETSSSEEQHLAVVVPFARRPSESTSTSFPQYPPEDQQEELRTSVGEDETRSASVLPASTPLSPLSVGVLQEAAQTTLTTGTATVTAHAVSTTIEPSSPLDHVLIIGHGRFQRIVLVCTTLGFFTTIVHAMASTTLARSVDHWCSQCHRYDPPFDLLSDEAGHDASADNRSVIPCDAGWHFETGPISDGPDYHGHSGKLDFKHPHSIVVEWNLCAVVMDRVRTQGCLYGWRVRWRSGESPLNWP